MFTTKDADNQFRDQRHLFSAYLSSPTTITFTRYESTFATDLTIEWEVVEFAADTLQSLQTGSVSPVAGTTDVAITAINTAAAFPIQSFSTNQGNVGRQMPRPSFGTTTSPGDTLRLTVLGTPTAGTYNTRWQVVEFKSADVTVQSGSTHISDAYNGTATIAAVDLSKTLVARFNDGGNGAGVRANVRVYPSSTTQLRFDLQPAGTPVDFNVTWYAISLKDASTVQAGTTTVPNNSTAPASAPTWSAMTNGSLFSVTQQPNAFVNNTTTDVWPQDIDLAFKMNAGQDGVGISRTGTSLDVALYYQAVDWAATPVAVGHRALILNGGQYAQITDAQLGTGLKPVVVDNGQLKQRAAAEGTPVIMENGMLRCLAANETLLL